MKKNLDSKKELTLHYQIIRKRKFLNQLYRDFYKEILALRKRGITVELGSGGGFIKELDKNIITSDVIKNQDIDKVFSASKIPFKKNTISNFVMLNTFHHIKNPEAALLEMQRCLVKGGKIIMIEPYNTIWGKFIYKNFHYEDFDDKANWRITKKGRLSGANNALPWIIFGKDIKIFNQEFPSLKIKKIRLHTPIRYLVSGRLYGHQLVPSLFYPMVFFMEKIVSPLNKYIAMFATIEIIKKN